MNRRNFLRNSSLAALAVSLPAAILMSACSGDTVKNILNSIIASVQRLLGLAGGAAWAVDLGKALAALQGQIATWAAGGAINVIEDGLNAVSAVLAVIPVTAVFSPLVAILVAGIEAVLLLIPQPTSVAVAASFTFRAHRARTNPYYGKVTLNKPLKVLGVPVETEVSAYKHQWNSQAQALDLKDAEI